MDLWPSNVQKVKLYDQVTAQTKYIKYVILMGKKQQPFLLHLQDSGDTKMYHLSWNKPRHH